MPWREAFSNDDIKTALAKCGIVAFPADFDDDDADDPVWEFDFDLDGDISLLTPGPECSFEVLRQIADVFRPENILVEALNTTLPPDGKTRLRINLHWGG